MRRQSKERNRERDLQSCEEPEAVGYPPRSPARGEHVRRAAGHTLGTPRAGVPLQRRARSEAALASADRRAHGPRLDQRLDTHFEINAQHDSALDVYHHPFSYVARSGADYEDGRLAA
jgi:hypothetical protein